jgi:Calcineurin-like phosphoesterase
VRNVKINVCLRRVLVACILIAATAAARASEKVVAIGDVHGAYPEFVSILQRTHLVDADLNWAGGPTTFVQLGDILDRGGESRKALDLLMKLQTQAPQQQGKVIPLIGNHEMMDMMGDLRYVSAGEYEAFATDQSEKIREKAFEDYKKFMAGHAAPGAGSEQVDRDKWMAEHPLGFIELRDAYGPQGKYGRWFRSHDAVVEIGDVLFLHGGLDPDVHYRSVEEINKRIHEELKIFDSLWKSLADEKVIWPYMTLQEAIHQVQGDYEAARTGGITLSLGAQQDIVRMLRDLPHWWIISPQGPLWYRGLAEDPESPLQDKLNQMLARLNARYIVMGHTVLPAHQITARFDHHAFLIDTGMNKAFFDGRPSALIIQDGGFTAEYADGEKQVLVSPKEGQAAPALNGGGTENKQQP